MKKLATIITLLCFGILSATAQDMRHISLNADLNGDTVDGPGAGLRIYDDGGEMPYGHGYDYSCVVRSTCDSSDTAKTDT